MIILEVLSVVFLGLVLGSFTTAMVYRIPRGHPWAFVTKKHAPNDVSAYRSACTHCNTTLKPIDLIPVFSWMFRRGKCAHCGVPIGLMYPLTELGVVFASLCIYLVYGLTIEAVFLYALVPFLMALLVIDLEHFILPNQLVAISGVLGLGYLVSEVFVFQNMTLEQAVFVHGGGAVVFAGLSFILGWIMTKVLKKDALGFGDVKFFAIAGLWLGLSNISWFCIFAGVLGVLLAFVWQVIKKQKVFPFGPALIMSLFALLLFDGSLLL